MKVSKFFPYLLIFTTIGGTAEIDLSLPSFPDIARTFAVSESVVQLTISLCFAGFCLAAILTGPLADRYGRRPTMLVGCGIYLIGSFFCALAPSIEVILVSRFLQGMGAAMSFVVVFTMLSDVYQGSEATKWIGLLNAISTAVMAAAPIAGGFLNSYYGWQSCYTVIAIHSVITLILLYLYLPETREGTVINLQVIKQDYIDLLSCKRFLLSASVPCLLAASWFSFVAIIPFYYRDELKMTPVGFAVHQGIIIGIFSIVSFFAGRICKRFGESSSALKGLNITALFSLLFVLLSYYIPTPLPWAITAIMFIYAGACAISFAALFSASLSIIPEKNGPASSIGLSLRCLLCAGTVQLSGMLYQQTLLPTAIICCAGSTLAYMLAVAYYKACQSHLPRKI